MMPDCMDDLFVVIRVIPGKWMWEYDPEPDWKTDDEGICMWGRYVCEGEASNVAYRLQEDHLEFIEEEGGDPEEAHRFEVIRAENWYDNPLNLRGESPHSGPVLWDGEEVEF